MIAKSFPAICTVFTLSAVVADAEFINVTSMVWLCVLSVWLGVKTTGFGVTVTIAAGMVAVIVIVIGVWATLLIE